MYRSISSLGTEKASLVGDTGSGGGPGSLFSSRWDGGSTLLTEGGAPVGRGGGGGNPIGVGDGSVKTFSSGDGDVKSNEGGAPVGIGGGGGNTFDTGDEVGKLCSPVQGGGGTMATEGHAFAGKGGGGGNSCGTGGGMPFPDFSDMAQQGRTVRTERARRLRYALQIATDHRTTLSATGQSHSDCQWTALEDHGAEDETGKQAHRRRCSASTKLQSPQKRIRPIPTSPHDNATRRYD